MALIDDFISRPDHSVRGRRFGAEVVETIGLAVSALAAGGRAAADYQRLSGLSSSELRRRGIPREELPQEVYRRHFARLESARDRR